MQKKDQLRDYIFSELARDNHSGNLSDDYSLVENGVIDSMAIVQLLSFIEDSFEISIEDEELIPENFETINAIYSLIQQKEVQED